MKAVRIAPRLVALVAGLEVVWMGYAIVSMPPALRRDMCFPLLTFGPAPLLAFFSAILATDDGLSALKRTSIAGLSLALVCVSALWLTKLRVIW
jgi:hypothetical protein